MIVVFDTTETFTDLRLEGPNFKLLKAYLKDTSSTLALPQIVVEETVNHFRERLGKHVRAAVDNLCEIGKLTGIEQKDVEVAINQDEAVQNYRQHLSAQIKDLSGTVVGFERVDVGELVQRSLQRRKPFDGEGRKGFRDAVLWETVLRELLAMNKQATVSLITKNSSDFGKDGALADSLVEDCRQIGRTAECVRLFNGLQVFIEAEVKPHLETLDAIREQLNEGGYKKFDPVELVMSSPESIRIDVRNQVQRCDFDRLTQWMIGRFHSPGLHSLELRPTAIKVADVWSIDDEQVAAGIDFTVDGEIECLEQHEVYYPEGDEVFSDSFDEQFIGDATFKISMTVILDKETGETADYEINQVETQLGHRWPRPDYK